MNFFIVIQNSVSNSVVARFTSIKVKSFLLEGQNWRKQKPANRRNMIFALRVIQKVKPDSKFEHTGNMSNSTSDKEVLFKYCFM
jgi:hypothetical protein